MRIAHICQWYIPGLSYQENFLPRELAPRVYAECLE